MRLFSLLLAASTLHAFPAYTVITDTWTTAAIESNSNTNNAVAGISAGGGSTWTLKSLTLDGFFVSSASYPTPNAADFSAYIKPYGNQPRIGQEVTASSASALVSNPGIIYDVDSRFSLTFDLTGAGWDVLAGSFTQIYIVRHGAAAALSPIRTIGPGVGHGGSYGFSYVGPVVITNMTAVPEPSTYGLALGGLALAVVAVRRRAKK